LEVNVKRASEAEERPAAAEQAAAAGNPAVPAKRLVRRNNSGSSLRDELVEIVKEDPDTAANVLRTWITNAN
jgi:flagellar biosynthesis/type III secretory pathway M-ring protein FliF/YscJ